MRVGVAVNRGGCDLQIAKIGFFEVRTRQQNVDNSILLAFDKSYHWSLYTPSLYMRF